MEHESASEYISKAYHRGLAIISTQIRNEAYHFCKSFVCV